MEDREKFLVAELVLTFSLLFYVTNLLSEVITFYRFFFIFGFMGGFVFSWFKKAKRNIINYIITPTSIVIFIWIVYSILNSSFFYKDVIIIWIKGLLFLQLILSFNACSPSILAYIQALCIPLFMSSPIFIKYYDVEIVILIFSYFIILFIILKLQFYKSLKLESKTFYRHYYSMVILIPIFLIISLLSLAMFYRFPLGEIRKGGVFQEAGIDAEKSMESLEKGYYDLQDGVQEKMTELIFKFRTQEERYEILAYLSSMIKESPYIVEVDKAHAGLIDYLHRPEAGLEKKETEGFTIIINNYLDKKITLNVRSNKDGLIYKLKNNSLNIKDRFLASSCANKIHYSSSYQQIHKNEKELKKIINDLALNSDKKEELKESTSQLAEWKGFQVYRGKIDTLSKKTESLRSEEKQKLLDLISHIQNTETLDDLKEIGKNINSLKDKIQPRSEEFIEILREILDLKLGMIISGQARELKEEIEGNNLAQYGLHDFKEYLDAAKDADNYSEFQESLLKLRKKAQDNNLNLGKGLKDFSETKIYCFAKEKKEKIEELMKENMPANVKSGFLEGLEKLAQEERREMFDSQIEKTKQEIEKFFNQGFISKISKDKLEKEIEGLKEILISQLTDKQAKLEAALTQDYPLNYQKQLEELIESSSLSSQAKKILQELARQILNAQTLSQLNNIQEAMKQDLESIPKEDLSKEELNAIKEKLAGLAEIKRMFLIDQASFTISKKIEELGQEGSNIEEYLRKIRGSKINGQLGENIKGLKESASKLQDNINIEGIGKIKKDQKNICKIYIIPSSVVIAKGSSLSLKTFAIYNDTFIKDLRVGLEWFSPGPNIAWVDEFGVLHAISQGKIRITATYKGAINQDLEVSVVDKISGEIEATIKNELEK